MRLYQEVTIELQIDGEYIPEVHGYISGQPENCYPGEGDYFETSTVKIRLTDGKTIDCPIAIADLIDEDELLESARND